MILMKLVRAKREDEIFYGVLEGDRIDRIEGDYYIGRTEFDSPEVDPEVLISHSGEELEIGQFYRVEVTDADDFDLYAKIMNKYE